MTTTQKARPEGWSWFKNSRKWHYYRDGRSLCGRRDKLFDGDECLYADYDIVAPDCCRRCWRRRRKEKSFHYGKSTEKPRREGWSFLLNSYKQHYFHRGFSLCGRFSEIMVPGKLQSQEPAVVESCIVCRRKRTQEQAARS